jgi:hypothetical protein
MNSSSSRNTGRRNANCDCTELDHRLEYKVRVRVTPTQPYLFLWGSAGIAASNTTYQSPLLLHIRNDKHGEVVNFGTQVASGTQSLIGALQPGEYFSVQIQSISGVYASCGADLESTVYCVIGHSDK